MKEESKKARDEMKEQSRPYQTYGYYLAIPIAFIVFYIFSFLDFNVNSVGTILLVFTILANINASKLTLVSKRKYVAPILIYVVNAIGLLFFVPIIIEISSGGTGDVFLGLAGLISIPIQIVAWIFFFITANDIKKAYPDMKQVAADARQNYLNLKKSAR